MGLRFALLVFMTSNMVIITKYSLQDKIWRSSVACHISSALSAISVLMGSLCLCALYLFRYKPVTSCFALSDTTERVWMKVLLFLWLISTCFITGSLYIQKNSTGQLYQSSSLCILFLLNKSVKFNIIDFVTLITDIHLLLSVLFIDPPLYQWFIS